MLEHRLHYFSFEGLPYGLVNIGDFLTMLEIGLKAKQLAL